MSKITTDPKNTNWEKRYNTLYERTQKLEIKNQKLKAKNEVLRAELSVLKAMKDPPKKKWYWPWWG